VRRARNTSTCSICVCMLLSRAVRGTPLGQGADGVRSGTRHVRDLLERACDTVVT
jgi:hypothetical protein